MLIHKVRYKYRGTGHKTCNMLAVPIGDKILEANTLICNLLERGLHCIFEVITYLSVSLQKLFLEIKTSDPSGLEVKRSFVKH